MGAAVYFAGTAAPSPSLPRRAAGRGCTPRRRAWSGANPLVTPSAPARRTTPLPHLSHPPSTEGGNVVRSFPRANARGKAGMGAAVRRRAAAPTLTLPIYDAGTQLQRWRISFSSATARSLRTSCSSAMRRATRSISSPVAPADDRDVAGVQRHVAALDAFGGQRPQRRHVLRQADGDGDLGQLLRRLHAEDPAAPAARSGCVLVAPPTSADRHRHLERADQAPGLVDFPASSATCSGRCAPAQAWAPASIARQSLPVATTTGSMPFMMPLLCVAAR